MNSTFGYHLVAFLTVAVWGSTFVFTKMLLLNGLSPAQIFTLRFIIAYVLLLLFELLVQRDAFHLFCSSWKDELVMVALGIVGGSLYFLSENAAMLYTTATNTSLIVCSCPLFAMLLVSLFYRDSERFTRVQFAGSLMACLGMAVVVLNGHFVLHLSPLGDSLAFAACLCWALYSLLMIPANKRYNTLFITRKVFFYGLVSMIPYFLIWPDWPPVSLVLRPDVLCNLLFLGSVASMACFLAWNWGMKKLGAVVVTNYVYFNPVTTVIFAWLILSERITLFFIIGTLLILLGMYLCNKRQKEAGTELKVNNSAKSKQTRWPGN